MSRAFRSFKIPIYLSFKDFIVQQGHLKHPFSSVTSNARIMVRTKPGKKTSPDLNPTKGQVGVKRIVAVVNQDRVMVEWNNPSLENSLVTFDQLDEDMKQQAKIMLPEAFSINFKDLANGDQEDSPVTARPRRSTRKPVDTVFGNTMVADAVINRKRKAAPKNNKAQKSNELTDDTGFFEGKPVHMKHSTPVIPRSTRSSKKTTMPAQQVETVSSYVDEDSQEENPQSSEGDNIPVVPLELCGDDDGNFELVETKTSQEDVLFADQQQLSESIIELTEIKIQLPIRQMKAEETVHLKQRPNQNEPQTEAASTPTAPETSSKAAQTFHFRPRGNSVQKKSFMEQLEESVQEKKVLKKSKYVIQSDSDKDTDMDDDDDLNLETEQARKIRASVPKKRRRHSSVKKTVIFDDEPQEKPTRLPVEQTTIDGLDIIPLISKPTLKMTVGSERGVGKPKAVCRLVASASPTVKKNESSLAMIELKAQLLTARKLANRKNDSDEDYNPNEISINKIKQGFINPKSSKLNTTATRSVKKDLRKTSTGTPQHVKVKTFGESTGFKIPKKQPNLTATSSMEVDDWGETSTPSKPSMFQPRQEYRPLQDTPRPNYDPLLLRRRNPFPPTPQPTGWTPQSRLRRSEPKSSEPVDEWGSSTSDKTQSNSGTDGWSAPFPPSMSQPSASQDDDWGCSSDKPLVPQKSAMEVNVSASNDGWNDPIPATKPVTAVDSAWDQPTSTPADSIGNGHANQETRPNDQKASDAIEDDGWGNEVSQSLNVQNKQTSQKDLHPWDSSPAVTDSRPRMNSNASDKTIPPMLPQVPQLEMFFDVPLEDTVVKPKKQVCQPKCKEIVPDDLDEDDDDIVWESNITANPT